MPAQKINTAGFLSEFLRRHELLPDRPFCWVLGSGASFQSGIPTGGSLAKKWLEELHEMEDLENQPIEKWATAKNLGIKNFDFKNAATFYPWIYWRRFRKFREEGYAFLEKVMEDIEPSYGYSVLAQIMADKQHKAAITTNFDNLIADALAIYTRALPLVCGHESLTGFIRPNLQRPLIAKIHRDLLLNPKNAPDEIEELPKEWVNALTTIFSNYTPIIIGYGGNDGSLMGLLKSLPPIKGGIFWCYRFDDEPDARIHEIVERHDGSLVPIIGFDELMLQLWQCLKLPDPIPLLQRSHDQRKMEFIKQFEQLKNRINQPGKNEATEAMLKEIRRIASLASERLNLQNHPMGWVFKALAEKDVSKHEGIYREGLKKFPYSPELTAQLASLMETTHKDYDEAERLHRRAVELDPTNTFNLGSLAYFLETIRKNMAEAELLWRKVEELDPNPNRHLNSLGCLNAILMKDYMGSLEELRNSNSNSPMNGLALIKLGKQFEHGWKVPKAAFLFYGTALKVSPNDKDVQTEYTRFLKEYPEFSK
jgi:tetratricopeptide (TPR) repeat protein